MVSSHFTRVNGPGQGTVGCERISEGSHFRIERRVVGSVEAPQFRVGINLLSLPTMRLCSPLDISSKLKALILHGISCYVQ